MASTTSPPPILQLGCVPSPPRRTAPPSPAAETSLSDYLVCVVFCPREPNPEDSVCNLIMAYNPSNNSWSYLTSIPNLIENQVLKGFAMVTLGDSIYIIGGLLCHKERVHVSDETAGLIDLGTDVSSRVLRYNIRTNEWFTCGQLGVARYDFACTVCDNKIYVAGGKTTLDIAQGISSTEVYDPGLDTWTPLPNLNTLRYKSVGVTWQGKVYVVGGFAERGGSGDRRPCVIERSSAEVYNTEAQRWDIVAGMWQLDVPPNQIVEVDGTLYSSGDCLNAWKGQIEFYDGKLWNEVEGSRKLSLSSLEGDNEDWPCNERQRLFLTMAAIGTRLFFLAGCKKGGELGRTMSIVHIFDTSAIDNPWRSLEPMEFEGEKELCSHCCVVKLS